MIEWIKRLLEKRLEKKRQQVIKLRWRKEQLEKIKRERKV